jgi:plastocyanin
MNKGLLIIGAVVILLVGGFLVLRGSSSPAPAETAFPTNEALSEPSSTDTGLSTPTISPATGTTSQNTIEYGSTGFSPTTITVKVGDSVTWTNNSSSTVQVSSDPHPTHTDFPPLNSVGAIAPGSSKSFTFTKSGTFGYHNHLNPSDKGEVIVK